MAVRYVSHLGSNTAPYDTWAKAATTLTTVFGSESSGDVIYVAQDHVQSGTSVSCASAGTAASPIKIICADRSVTPPNAVAETASVTATAGDIALGTGATQHNYWYGLKFTSSGQFPNNGYQLFDNCTFHCTTTSGTNYVGGGNYKNCTFRFSAAGQRLFTNTGGLINVTGGSLHPSSTSPTSFIAPAQTAKVVVDGFDLSNAAAGVNLTDCTGLNNLRVILRNMKLPASWSGALSAGAPGGGSVVEMFNCDSGDTNYRYRRAMQCGDIYDETTRVRTGGASDGTTNYSLRMASNSTAEFPYLTLDTPEIVKWNDTVGSPITVTFEILHDSVTALTDAEIWLEGMYLGTSGVPLASFIHDGPADVLAAPAAQASSSETWTTTGMTNPNTQKLSVTFTPQEAGYMHFTVKLATASTTVYVDPKPVVT